jgi:hypothetical protein
MPRCQFYWFALVLILGCALGAFAADDEHEHRATTNPSRVEPGGAPRPNMERDMKAIERAFKQLKSQISDSTKNDSSLELVTQMEQSTLASKSQIPPKVRRMPTTQQAEEANNYRQMMVSLFRLELDLEEQLINGDNTKAATTWEEMDKLQKDGHHEFRGKRGD